MIFATVPITLGGYPSTKSRVIFAEQNDLIKIPDQKTYNNKTFGEGPKSMGLVSKILLKT